MSDERHCRLMNVLSACTEYVRTFENGGFEVRPDLESDDCTIIDCFSYRGDRNSFERDYKGRVVVLDNGYVKCFHSVDLDAYLYQELSDSKSSCLCGSLGDIDFLARELSKEGED